MTVYIDLVFLINFLYDYLILNAVNSTLNRFVKQRRILIGTFIGSFALIFLFYNIHFKFLYIIFLSFIMIFVTFGFKDFKYFKNNVVYFYMISFILGGILYLLNSNLNNNYSLQKSYDYMILINIVFLFVFSPMIYFIYVHSYKSYSINNKNYYNLKFSFDEKLYDVISFYDSGNLVKDPYKGKPVILVNEKIIRSDIRNKSPIYVPCNMVNNSTLIKCYKPNLIIINNKVISNVLIGLWDNKCFFDNVNAILSGYIGDIIK